MGPVSLCWLIRHSVITKAVFFRSIQHLGLCLRYAARGTFLLLALGRGLLALGIEVSRELVLTVLVSGLAAVMLPGGFFFFL